MKANGIEVIVGAAVLLVAIFFLGFAYKSSQWQHNTGYTIEANFDRVDGLSTGSDVRVNGVKVGHVGQIRLDASDYVAHVTIALNSEVKIPTDSIAEVASDGLLGSKYMSITPGNKDSVISPGGTISRTRPATGLDSLISKFLFNKGESDGKKAADQTH